MEGIKQLKGADHCNHSTQPEEVLATKLLPQTPVAICGMGVRLPGGVRNDTDLYNLLINKQDARVVVPADRYNIDAYYDPRGRPGSIITRHGYYLQEDLSKFDASMFSMSNAEISYMDPSQRFLLEVTREAFESAGESDFRGKNIGTFIGDFTTDWQDIQHADLMHNSPFQPNGEGDFVLSNRLSYEYNLTGPSVNIKTACSATAEALNEAVLAIRAGSCPSAIVGGANLIMAPRGSIGMTLLGVLSPDGACKTFDASADGFGRGESVCALFIKRLDLALQDGNPVRAVIRACCSNADGGSTDRAFSTPNPLAQEALIRKTYADAGLDLDRTGVIECHGTGTQAGDTLETEAVANCFAGGFRDVFIGSIKPNLGHAEGGSAMGSIIKSILALENRTIIPNVRFDKPNPKIAWDRKLRVPIEPIAWPKGYHERISINSFGLGGSNTHIVLDSASSMGIYPRQSMPDPVVQELGLSRKSILLLSANSPSSMGHLTDKCKRYVEDHPERIENMAYTLGNRRERLRLATYSIVEGDTMTGPPAAISSPRLNRIAFVFTGQGAQWIGMGKDLLQEQPVFAHSIRVMDGVMKSLYHPPDWTIEETLLLEQEADKPILHATHRAQPVSTAMQIALVDLLASWNIVPSAVVGHSSGEVAAAYAAGILNRRDAIAIAYYRGYACAQNRLVGGMAAVGLGRESVEPYLKCGVVIACENSNASVTLSGDEEALHEIMVALREQFPSALVRRLQVPMGYHSHHMKTISGLYHDLIGSSLQPQAPQVPYFSTVYGRRVLEGKVFGAAYWRLNMESPVFFRTAVSDMLKKLGSDYIHFEVGPHSSMAGPLRQIYEEIGISAPYASVMVRGKSSSTSFLEGIGKLFCLGITPKIPTTGFESVLPDLPTYPWNHENKFWSETRAMSSWRFMKHRHHELLGNRVRESTDLDPSWRNLLNLSTVPWLKDHCVGDDIVFPAAAYIAMAGVAISQVSHLQGHYTVRDFHVAKALILNEDTATELITTLRKLTPEGQSKDELFEFAISSESRGYWTKHCSGIVSANSEITGISQPNELGPFSRKVEKQRWYKAMSRIGLNYGPRFVGLDDISCHPAKGIAFALLADRQDEHEPYSLHPTTIDMILQSWAVAQSKGQCRVLTQLLLPTFIKEISVSPAAGEALRVQTKADTISGMPVGSSIAISEERVVFSMTGLTGTAMDAPLSDPYSSMSTLTLQWHRDLDLIDPRSLVHRSRDMSPEYEILDQIFVLFALQNVDKIRDVDSPHVHLNHYRSWLIEEVEQIMTAKHIMSPSISELVALDKMDRELKLADLLQQSQSYTMSAAIETYARISSNMSDIILGKNSLLSILMEDDLISRFYQYFNEALDLSQFYQVAGLNKPHMRVLEIGAGTGGWTSDALKGLTSDNGIRLYDEYTISDVSTGFLSECQKRFGTNAHIKYTLLDISADPLEQGFEARSFDLIIASNVLHATPRIVESLSNCRTLLKPTGRLLIQEACSADSRHGFAMGLFEGWWMGINDGRPRKATISTIEWDQRLKLAGFEGATSVVYDNDPGYSTFACMIAQPRKTIQEDRLTLLYRGSDQDELSTRLRSRLEISRFRIDLRKWGSEVPQNQAVLSIVDIQGSDPVLSEDNPETLNTFLGYIKNTSSPYMLWLTKPAQTHCTDPRHGIILGMARTVRAELGISFATLELDVTGDGALDAVSRVVQKLRDDIQSSADMGYSDGQSSVMIDHEYCFCDGELLLPRFHPFSLDDALLETTLNATCKRPLIGARDDIDPLEWVGSDHPLLGPNQIELKMTTVAITPLTLTGAMADAQSTPSTQASDALGSEGTGIVTKIGSNVSGFREGDYVATVDFGTSVLASTIQSPANACVQIEPNPEDVSLAGVLIPYITTLWSLVDKARLCQGQSVLICSAASAMGVAAVHVARWIGAEVFALTDSEGKADFLANSLQIPYDHIFQPGLDLFDDLVRANGGKGVDVVFNSACNSITNVTWQCIAPGGCMVNIGELDTSTRKSLGRYLLDGNKAFFGVDFPQPVSTRPSIVQDLLKQVMELLKDRSLPILGPVIVYDAQHIEDALRLSQKDTQMGRVVVQMPQDESAIMTVPRKHVISFRDDATYLLVGGVGGLGRSVVRWMSVHGAKDITVVSRSAGSQSTDQELRAEMSDIGCSLHFYPADVTDLVSMRDLVSGIGKRIAGVFNMAMVLNDVSTLDLDFAAWTKVTKPKIQGTWNLHNLIPVDLDFFVLFGSISGTLASYGQANYASGNSFLDSFVRFRHDLGLVASVVDIAAIGDVGYIAETSSIAEQMERAFGSLVTEQDFLNALHLSIMRSNKFGGALEFPGIQTTRFIEDSQILMQNVMRAGHSNNPVPWKDDVRMAIYRNNEQVSEVIVTQTSQRLGAFLVSIDSSPEKLDDPETPKIFAQEIGKRIATFLMMQLAEGETIDTTQALLDMGMDSLVAIEIRNWWRQTFGMDISLLELNHPGQTLESLGQLAAERLKKARQNPSSSRISVS